MGKPLSRLLLAAAFCHGLVTAAHLDERIGIPEHIAPWIPTVRGQGAWASDFVKVLPIGPNAHPDTYQELSASQSRGCARQRSGQWMVTQESGWVPSTVQFEPNAPAAKDWPVLAVATLSVHLGYFAPLAGHWGGRPVLANWSSDNIIHTVLYWCHEWVFTPFEQFRLTRECPPPAEKVFGPLSFVWHRLDLTGPWSVFGGGGSAHLGVLTVSAVTPRLHGWAMRPTLDAVLDGWQGTGVVSPTAEGLKLLWGFESSSPWPGQYPAHVDPEGNFLVFLGDSWWIRVHFLEKLQTQSPQLRAQDLVCTHKMLAKGADPQQVCGAAYCSCASTWVPGSTRGVWPIPIEVFTQGVRWAWIALILFVVAILLLGIGSHGPVAVIVPPGKLPSRVRPLQAIRLLGAVHIVVFHCYPHLPLAQWGGPAWISWYFLMSGFGLTWQSVHTNTQARSLVSRVTRRILGIYPLHIVALLLGGMSMASPFFNSLEFAKNLLLMQAWRLDGSPAGEPWNHVNWFLSTLFVYYLLFDATLARLLRIPSRRLPIVLILCWSWSLWGEVVRAIFGLNLWNNAEVVTVLYKQFRYTHFLCHYHCFVFGMALALVVSGPASRFVPRGTASAVLVGIGLVFCVIGPWKAYFPIWNGFFLPLYGLVVAGFTWREEPAAYLLDRPFADFLGELAWPLYITHVVVLRLYQRYWILEFPPRGPTYPLMLLAVAVGLLLVVDRPLQRVIRRRQVKVDTS